MAMSDKIESFIIELLKDYDSDWLELGRNELAGIFNCVPSQINYVLSTRFTPEKGYEVESRRGGGGYIKIRRGQRDMPFDIREISENLGDAVSEEKAQKIINYLFSAGHIDEKVKQTAEVCLLGGILPTPELRAEMLKRILANIM